MPKRPSGETELTKTAPQSQSVGVKETAQLVKAMADIVYDELPGMRERLDRIARHVAGGFNSLLPIGDPFWESFRQEMPEVEREIARYACEYFVTDRLRSFVEASPIAVHLAQQIALCQKQPNLIYTNSVFVPLAILPANPAHKVYAFCGPTYDSECGGWLFADEETGNELKTLFTRQRDPLTTVFLSPIATKPESGPYYGRPEAAQMARWLMEGAQQIVVMAPASRLYTESQPFPQNKAWERGWLGGAREIHVVISSTPSDGRYLEIVEAFRQTKQPIQWRVHWKDPTDGNWKTGE